jgi:putative transposase
MIAFIDAHRGDYGVEPICRVLPIAPSTYHDHAVKQRDPSRLLPRARRDLALKPEILRVHAENLAFTGCARYGGRCALRV